MPSFKMRFLSVIYICAAVLTAIPNAWGNAIPRGLEDVGIDEHLGARVPMSSLHFRDEKGESVALESYFKPGKPVLLALVYYNCPNLCNLLLSGLVESLKGFTWIPGREFELVAVSIDPTETPQIAQQKKEHYLKAYGNPSSEPGWHFLTGNEADISALAKSVGFRYHYVASEKQYAHASVITLLSPEGVISRYLYGIHFPSQNLKLGLIDASKGKLGTVGDQLLLFCLHFDPSKNSYTLRMWRVVQVVLTVQALVLFLGLFILWRKEKPNVAT